LFSPSYSWKIAQLALSNNHPLNPCLNRKDHFIPLFNWFQLFSSKKNRARLAQWVRQLD
jgi:hypothetical protein